ncbi:MAG: GAF domain-containing protein [Pseudonocardiaceae bacterium]|nr:GAF domain-containing protein [Pseudonocardiaceae bacterium]
MGEVASSYGGQALRRLLDVVSQLGAERRSESVLRSILDAARDLAAARYAAVGVPDGDGGFALFLTAGVDARTWERIGALPRTHGLLGELVTRPEVIRLADIRTDPRFRYYPPAHPQMRSFLGVPIMAGGEVVAALYLADKEGAAEFTDADQELIETLAGHAALAVVNAQRQERLRELSIADERTRIARDLHDSVTQSLFSLTLAAESAATVAGGDSRAAPHLDRVRELSQSALAELRALTETLRPPDVDREGLGDALRKRVALLRAVHDVPIELQVRGRGGGGAVGREVLKVANEAIGNALAHAEPGSIRVQLDLGRDALRLGVSDDGRGFDLAEARRASRRLGLTSMRERAEALGGSLVIDAAPGTCTTVTLEVPAG